MTLEVSIWMVTSLVCFLTALQSVEYISLSFNLGFNKIWNIDKLRPDLIAGLPLSQNAIHFLFSERAFRAIVTCQLLVSLIGFFNPSAYIFIILFLIHLLVCIRFRGTFNGGSDMMTFVLLTGLIISTASGNQFYQKAGLIYICIHTLLSYFKAGLAKVRSHDWRSGIAVSAFLERSIYPEVRVMSQHLANFPHLSIIICWSVILFELAALILPFLSFLALPYFAIAVVFHFLNFLCFGLNRFFWAWIAAWPAVLYTAAITGQVLN